MKDYRFIAIVMLLMVIIGVLIHFDEQMTEDEKPTIIFQCGSSFD